MPFGKRRTGSGNSKRKGTYKRQQRKTFATRHIDQVWEDVRKDEGVLFTREFTDRLGPSGTTDKAVIDEDVPGGGAFYCTPCSRYFVNEHALSKHCGTKPHKRRLKEVAGARPHTQINAEKAAGMGAPDNGEKARPAGMEM